MRVYEMDSNSTSVSDLDLPLSGLYLLAAPSTPLEARQAVAERVENGERLSVAEVRETITKTKADAPSLIPDKPKAKTKPSYIPTLIDNAMALIAQMSPVTRQEFDRRYRKKYSDCILTHAEETHG